MSAVGQVLGGRYRLEEMLGSGGFADVYRAIDTGPLGRRVAVKLLHPHLTRQQDFLDRFRREAATIAALKHPHILDVYDFGEQDGVPYLVMPYIPGGTLDNRLQSGRLDPPQVAAYLKQIAGALDYAHQRRIVHRDLKPQNFLVDDGDNLLLADFGIAKLMQETSLASGGTAIVGTLPYMAPELFQGQPAPASDQYALGCMAFQFLIGAPPYAGTASQLMYAHIHAPIPTLAERGGAHLPAALGPVLARALAKRPEERYASAGDFTRAFEAALAETHQVPRDIYNWPTLASKQNSTQVGIGLTESSQRTITASSETVPVARSRLTPVATERRHAPRRGLAGVGAIVVLALLATVGTLVIRGRDPVRNTPSGTGQSASPTIGTSASTFKGESFATLSEHTGGVNWIQWSPDGRTLVSRSNDHSILLWGADGQFLATISDPLAANTEFVWSPDGQLLAVTYGIAVRLISPDGTVKATLSGHAAVVRNLAWSPDGRTLASADDDGVVRLWGPDGTGKGTLSGHTSFVLALAWAPDGQLLASASGDGTIRLWGADGRAITVMRAETGVLVWSPDGRVLASDSSQSGNSTLYLWGSDGREIAKFSSNDHAAQLAWSPDSRILARLPLWDSSPVQLWSVEGRAIADLTAGAYSLAWSPDSRTVAVASNARDVLLWGTDGSAKASFVGHTDAVTWVAWTADGRMLASGSADQTVRLWGADGVERMTLRGHTDEVWVVSWSPDGRILASASKDGTVRLWR